MVLEAFSESNNEAIRDQMTIEGEANMSLLPMQRQYRTNSLLLIKPRLFSIPTYEDIKEMIKNSLPLRKEIYGAITELEIE